MGVETSSLKINSWFKAIDLVKVKVKVVDLYSASS